MLIESQTVLTVSGSIKQSLNFILCMEKVVNNRLAFLDVLSHNTSSSCSTITSLFQKVLIEILKIFFGFLHILKMLVFLKFTK